MAKQRRVQPQWWETLAAGDKLVCTYTDQFVGVPIGSVAYFVRHEGGGLRLETADRRQCIYNASHWCLYESDEQQRGIIERWNSL